MTTLFISGIDTEVGKSVACGALAKTLLAKKLRVFTQKWVETGIMNSDAMVSADLAVHQDIAGVEFNTAEYAQHVPYLFRLPASPHLAAKIEKQKIDCAYLEAQTRKLESQCDHLLIEGAGGLCVPLNEQTLSIDLVAKLSLPIVLVTSGKLGSINHTILSLDYCRQRDLDIRAIIYNFFPGESTEICKDSRKLLQNLVKKMYPETLWLDMQVDATSLNLDDRMTSKLIR